MMRSLRVWGASPWFLLFPAALAAPPLLFSAFVPRWAPLAAIAALALVGLLRCVATGRVLGHTPADWPLLLIALTLPIGLWASADHEATLSRTYAFIANLALFCAVAGLARSSLLRWSGWGLLVAAIAFAGVFLVGTRFGAAKLTFFSRDILTLLSGGLNPFWNEAGFNANLAGGVLALFWPPAMTLLIAGESRLQRLAALAATAVLSVMLMLAQSRGALLAVTLVLPVITVMHNRRWLWAWMAVVIAGVAYLIGCLGGVSLEALLDRNSMLGVSSLQGRVELWSRALFMIQDFPFTGVGLGMFEPVVKLLYPTFLIGSDAPFNHAHNIYLQIAAEMGIPGLIGHLALYGVLGALLVRRSKGHGGERYRVLNIGLLGSLLVYLTHGLTDAISFYLRTAFIIWSLFGLMVAVATAEMPHSAQPGQAGAGGC